MQKVYQIMQIIETLGVLVSEIQALCVKSIFRFMFDILFFFAPQLNPFNIYDGYRAAMKDQGLFFACPKCHKGAQLGQPGSGGGGGSSQNPPQDGSQANKPPTEAAIAEALLNGNDPLKTDGLACPVACGYAE